jgi:type VI secretion system secreted protein Hcp
MEAIFLKIDSIKGDSDVDGHKEEIELLSFSHGVAQQVTGDVSNTQRTSGRPMHQDMVVTKYVDKSSPTINQNCCEAKNLGEVVLTITRNDEGNVLEFLVYKMKDVIISSVSTGGGGGGKPTETLSLNYSAISWTVTVQKKEGGKEGEVVGKWNLATNKVD